MNFSQALILIKLDNKLKLEGRDDFYLAKTEDGESIHSIITKQGAGFNWNKDILRDDWEIVDERPKNQQPA
jgi:hypothetical protein